MSAIETVWKVMLGPLVHGLEEEKETVLSYYSEHLRSQLQGEDCDIEPIYDTCEEAFENVSFQEIKALSYRTVASHRDQYDKKHLILTKGIQLNYYLDLDAYKKVDLGSTFERQLIYDVILGAYRVHRIDENQNEKEIADGSWFDLPNGTCIQCHTNIIKNGVR